MNRETDLQTPLARLAARCGIADHYDDIWGEPHSTSVETQKALLRAMGIAADSEEQIAAALEQLERAKWIRPLPAILVVSRSKFPARIPVNVQGDSALAWRIVEENGPAHTGQSRAAELPLLEQHGVYARRELVLDPPLPLGYHRLELFANDESIAACALVVVPDTCYRPAALENEGRVFGPALQLYAVRSERNWGMGDFTDLRRMIEIWAQEGAAVIGVNPLNALFPHNPLHASPYSPSSRLFLNVLYLDVEAIPDFLECEGARALVTGRDFQLRLAHLREAEFVDYAGVAAAKMMVLELLFQHFRDQHLARGSERANQFRALTEHEGTALFQHALFEALQEHFHRSDPNVWGWPVWPEPYHDFASAEAARFAEQNRSRIEFYQYLQWNADLQLGAAGKRCLELGLGVGLYLDLPVSIDSAGAESWSHQSLYAMGARVGAPPDEWNPNGQDWGLPPFNPERLTEAAYAPWISMLRHNMRHAGAIRIDHVMQLLRLFWVPPGARPSEGTYVYYPLHDLLGILALESQRNQCLVVGEDLGTVPNEVRNALGPLGVLSYRLLYFEKNDQGDFKPPGENPRQALIAISTHDLPTLAGYWQGQDLNVRSELQLFPSDKVRQQAVLARSQDRARLLLALEQEELLPNGMTIDPASAPVMTPELARALHRYAARSPAQLMMVQIEDITGQLDQVNLPNT
ncbi:MAG TPA: 4-alpha-glucanotransferase, partial [Burkholderiales bacterium]|nr:4-alpha-glucanotransferase [Burkholderiales bacterium]